MFELQFAAAVYDLFERSPDRLGDFVFVFVDLAIVSLAQGVEVDLGEYAIEVFDDIPVIQIQHRLAQSAVIVL